MAVTWGSYANGTHNFRLGYEFVVTADSNTSRTVRLDIWFYGDWGVDDSVNSFGVSGSWSASGAIDLLAAYNTAVKIWSQSQTFSKVYGATQNKSFSSSFSGLEAYGTGTTATVAGTHTVPARPYDLPTAPGAPVISLITGTSARVTWPDPSSWGGDDTSDFRVEVSINDTFTATETSTVLDANIKDLTGLSPYADRWVRVLAFNSAGDSVPSAAAKFKTLALLPTAPGNPVISLLTGTGARADWADPASWGGNDTSAFDLQISDDPGMASPTTIPQGDNDHTFTGLTPGADKYIWVYAKNAAGNGPPSGIKAFTLLDYPSAPQTPTVSGLKSNKVTLTVTAPADNGGAAITAYRFQVSTDPTFATTLYNVQAATLTRDVTGLDPSTDHYWRAAGVNSVGQGAWVSGTFRTKSAAVIQKAGVVKQISAIYVQKAGVPKLVTKVGVKSASWRY